MSDNTSADNQKEDSVSPKELIDTIEKLEYALIQLIQISADGIESIGDKEVEVEEEYKNITTAYYSLLQRISDGMRNVLESLIHNGYLISTTTTTKDEYISVYK